MERARTTKAIWLLLAATLFLRALVPAGWMPDTDRTDVIVAKMCNSPATVTITLDRDTSPDEPAAHESGACLFAGFAGDAPLPEMPVTAGRTVPPAQQPIGVLAELLLERTAFLLPPGRAPPVAA
ncbi:hypothetical protein EKJ_08920 [Qipengyuania flava]|uniref:DUF2946 domain-containing protein n=1 Tax=Qipengyuania flava TaxID=192812 RepID=A0A3T1CGD5_9SPHN|nr:hypothetical protein [Qipengyuania flava]BBI20045.1 hypothetical protein EKJ_08920 [Qipengyuania flava]